MRWLLILSLLATPSLAGATQVPPGFTDSLVAGGLQQPTAAEFSQDGRLFILQKNGSVRIYKNGGLLPGNALSISVSGDSERGLLGIAFDPGFLQNHFVYLYYTTAGGDPKNRVSRFVVNGDTIDRGSETVMVDGIRSDAGNHNAGWIQFGPDSKLYIATGDGGADPQQSQNLSGINGKILRINSDGTVPGDNPFATDAGRRGEIWCYGLRNPWRFTFDRSDGALIIGDVGQNTFEEVNLGRAGGNYGWPNAEGTSGNTNFVNPIFTYNHNGGDASITGGIVYSGTAFPQEYRGAYFFSDYVLGFIRYLKFGSNHRVESVNNFSPDAGNVVHLTQGTDGAIYYVVIGSGQVRRIRFGSGNNREPVLHFKTSRRFGPVPLTINFSAADSFDPDGDTLTYRWNFGDGTTANTKSIVHIYDASQNFTARLIITDSHGASKTSAPIRVFPGDRAAVPIITIPAPGTTVRPGDVVRFAGEARDPEDGVLSATQFTWVVVQHHNGHTHPFLGPLHGTRNGSFTVPIDDHTDGTVFYRIRLRVTDSRGLSVTRIVDVPRQ